MQVSELLFKMPLTNWCVLIVFFMKYSVQSLQSIAPTPVSDFIIRQSLESLSKVISDSDTLRAQFGGLSEDQATIRADYLLQVRPVSRFTALLNLLLLLFDA